MGKVFFLIPIALSLVSCGIVPADSIVVDDPFVNASTGLDTNNGNSLFPLKTISKALSVVQSGHTVTVVDGTYDISNGEHFPLIVPAGITLTDDPLGHGSGMVISGAGVYSIPGGGSNLVTLVLNNASGAVITGIKIDAHTDVGIAVVNSDNVLINSNSVINGTPGIGIYQNVTNLVVTNNFVNSNTIGMRVFNSTASMITRANSFSNNGTGVRCDNLCGTFGDGGGSATSPGQNDFGCNSVSGFTSGFNTAFALQDNFWDNVPPVSGDDIQLSGGGTYNATGAIATSCTP